MTIRAIEKRLSRVEETKGLTALCRLPSALKRNTAGRPTVSDARLIKYMDQALYETILNGLSQAMRTSHGTEK